MLPEVKRRGIGRPYRAQRRRAISKVTTAPFSDAAHPPIVSGDDRGSARRGYITFQSVAHPEPKRWAWWIDYALFPQRVPHERSPPSLNFGIGVRMIYQNVCLEAFGYTLPTEIVTSAEIEQRLQTVYQRLKLRTGRLELMTGIRERRFWTPGTLPSEKSTCSADRAIEIASIDRDEIGALVHASVCRDHLEPATACAVHHGLGLSEHCVIYDMSNACLGILNGILQVANMIELGQIAAGLVVGSEGGRELVENTIEMMNRDQTLTRESIKTAVASLTIGSASCAALLVNRELSRTGNRLLHATATANTRHHGLCHSGRDEAVADDMRPLMTTDAERLMREGIATGVQTFRRFLAQADWSVNDIDRTFCHQVGVAHRRLMLESLSLEAENDFTTLEWLGNSGASALPITMAIGVDKGVLQPGDNVALLGIGSGINCVMIAVEWQRSLTSNMEFSADSESSAPPIQAAN